MTALPHCHRREANGLVEPDDPVEVPVVDGTRHAEPVADRVDLVPGSGTPDELEQQDLAVPRVQLRRPRGQLAPALQQVNSSASAPPSGGP
jgi:hypothetical protein